jgi:hypothetical protein
MNNKMMVAKRVTVLCMSFGTIIAFGYALGGLWGYIVGHGRPKVIALGLTVGIALAFAAMRIWRTYLEDIEREDREKENSSEEDQEQ